ncbi:hypothetical protein, partial [Cobetia amphilecti]|uniref:hypothetical protein n=1 Tax=Cobetia amphilecti TaxID=1055104 RepID=UPI001AE0B6AD
VEADFKNIKQNNHLQTSFTAGNAMRPRQRMRTLRTNRREGKGFLAAMPKRVQSGPMRFSNAIRTTTRRAPHGEPSIQSVFYRRFQRHPIKRTFHSLPSQQASLQASLQDA